MERDLFSPPPPPPKPEPKPVPLKVDLHPRYRAILREMMSRSVRIVVFSFASRGLARIRLEDWPRTKGITEKGLRALIDGGFVRKMIFHQKSRMADRYCLTTLGETVGLS